MVAPRKIYGIDPGASGAVAILWMNGNVRFCDTPVVKVKGKVKYIPEQMADIFIGNQEPGDIVVIENVHSMPGQGVASMFNMGYGCGLWRGIAVGLRLRVEMVAPQKWKKYLGIGRDKGESILKACSLYPKISDQLARVKDDGRAEALLIAHWYLSKISIGEIPA